MCVHGYINELHVYISRNDFKNLATENKLVSLEIYLINQKISLDQLPMLKEENRFLVF